jgi:hypothetical protein
MGGSDEVKETEYEKELAKVYKDQWNYYQKDVVPMEGIVIDEAKSSNDAKVYDSISGDVNLGYQKAFSKAGEQTLDNLAASGVDPSSGKAKGLLSDLSNEQASVSADAISRAQSDGQERYTDKMSNVMAMGQGEAQQAVASLSDIATNSQRKAFQDASISAQNKTNTLSTIGAVGGAWASNSMKKPGVDLNSPDILAGTPTNQSYNGTRVT